MSVADISHIQKGCEVILRDLREHNILHKDVSLVNWLWDPLSKQVILIDFADSIIVDDTNIHGVRAFIKAKKTSMWQIHDTHTFIVEVGMLNMCCYDEELAIRNYNTWKKSLLRKTTREIQDTKRRKSKLRRKTAERERKQRKLDAKAARKKQEEEQRRKLVQNEFRSVIGTKWQQAQNEFIQHLRKIRART